MMCERAGEVTAQTRSMSLPLGAIFCAYSKVCRYLLYLSKQLYNPQQMGSSSCLPAWEASPRSSSLLRFLSSRTDKCTGNGGPGLMECTATAGRLSLGLLGLEGDALGSSALLARAATINSSLALGDNGFGPKRLAKRSTALTLGTAATTWSTALACNVGSRKKLAKRQGPSCWRALTHARARLPSIYPLRDRSRSQVFVDEGESEGLASSYRGAIIVACR
jgi:hypothetical protein